jgi:hypothetical protein
MNNASSIDELLFAKNKDDPNINENEIKEMFGIFIQRIDKIEGKLDKLISIFEKDIKNNCAKMSGHIDFVENVYTTVKMPLTYMVNSVNYLSGQTDPLELTNVSNYNHHTEDSETADSETVDSETADSETADSETADSETADSDDSDAIHI